MFYFADAASEVSIALGAVVTITGSFLAIAKIMLNQSTKDREQALKERMDDRKERLLFVDAIKDLSKSGVRQAEATEKAAREAEKRNGHLAEISMENKNQIIDSINGLTINKQTVHHQTVEHETVKNKE